MPLQLRALSGCKAQQPSQTSLLLLLHVVPLQACKAKPAPRWYSVRRRVAGGAGPLVGRKLVSMTGVVAHIEG